MIREVSPNDQTSRPPILVLYNQKISAICVIFKYFCHCQEKG